MPAEPASGIRKPETPHGAARSVLASLVGFVVCTSLGVVALYFFRGRRWQGPLAARRAQQRDTPAGGASDHLDPESPHVAAWPVLFSVFGFVACVAAGVVALHFYYAHYLQGPLIPPARDFPEPKLQTDPEGDLQRFLAAQRAALTASAADPRGNPGKIPIERAMRMIMERGSHALDPLLPAATPSPQKTGAAP